MSENWTFFKQWVRNPARLGTFLPIQTKFSQESIRALIHKHKLGDTMGTLKVLELGAGTGRVTQTLLNEGFRDITAIELDPQLAYFMRHRFGDRVKVLNIDAALLSQHIAPHSIDIVVSVLPLMYIPLPVRQKIIDASFVGLKDTGIFWHTCYTPSEKLFKIDHIKTEKILTKWAHFPTGFVYEFKQFS